MNRKTLEMLQCVLASVALLTMTQASSFGAKRAARFRWALSWSELPELPPAPEQQKQVGLAGLFAGTHEGALLVAGGTMTHQTFASWRLGEKNGTEEMPRKGAKSAKHRAKSEKRSCLNRPYRVYTSCVKRHPMPQSTPTREEKFV